jgi:hypothetical protein
LACPANAHVQRLEPIGHVALDVFGVVTPVIDPAFTQKQIAALELARPDGAIGPGRFEASGIGCGYCAVDAEGQCRQTAAVVESGDPVRLAIPARISEITAAGVVGGITVGGVGEDVAGVVRNHIEDDENPLLVRGADEVAKFFAGAEVRVDVQEVLYPVAVVARLEGDLSEWRTDPERGHAETTEIPKLARQSFDRSALPAAAGAEPRVIINMAGIVGVIQRRRPGLDWLA